MIGQKETPGGDRGRLGGEADSAVTRRPAFLLSHASHLIAIVFEPLLALCAATATGAAVGALLAVIVLGG